MKWVLPFWFLHYPPSRPNIKVLRCTCYSTCHTECAQCTLCLVNLMTRLHLVCTMSTPPPLSSHKVKITDISEQSKAHTILWNCLYTTYIYNVIYLWVHICTDYIFSCNLLFYISGPNTEWEQNWYGGIFYPLSPSSKTI